MTMEQVVFYVSVVAAPLSGQREDAPDDVVRRHSGCEGFFSVKHATEPPAWRRKSYDPYPAAKRSAWCGFHASAVTCRGIIQRMPLQACSL